MLSLTRFFVELNISDVLLLEGGYSFTGKEVIRPPFSASQLSACKQVSAWSLYADLGNKVSSLTKKLAE